MGKLQFCSHIPANTNADMKMQFDPTDIFNAFENQQMRKTQIACSKRTTINKVVSTQYTIKTQPVSAGQLEKQVYVIKQTQYTIKKKNPKQSIVPRELAQFQNKLPRAIDRKVYKAT